MPRMKCESQMKCEFHLELASAPVTVQCISSLTMTSFGIQGIGDGFRKDSTASRGNHLQITACLSKEY